MRQRRLDLAARPRARTRPGRRSGSQTLSKTVAQGIRVGSWKTKPIVARASRAAASRSAPPVALAEAGDQAQRRALAAARGAEQAQELAPADGEVEAGQRLRAVGEALGDAMQGDERRAGLSVLSRRGRQRCAHSPVSFFAGRGRGPC